MAAYSIWVVSPLGYIHSHAFDEVALALESAFRELGHDARVVRAAADLAPTTVVLGCHLLPRVGLPKVTTRLILFNLEQIGSVSPWLTPEYYSLLEQHTVWDYSERNVETLRGMGISAVPCPLGYANELSRIPRGSEEIDVLFYGSISRRRAAILDELERRGLIVCRLVGRYGAFRDAAIRRSKVVLNLHHYDAKVFEIVRVLYLLANRRCVVSETGSDRNLEGLYAPGLVLVPYEDLVASCMELVTNNTRRYEVARAGFELVRSLPQSKYLRAALDTLTPENGLT